jgi:YVTN family beta-propeller protein
VPAGIAFSSDDATASVAFSRNNSLAVIDAETRKVKKEIPIGIAPFAVALRAGRRRFMFQIAAAAGRAPPLRVPSA